MLEDINFRTFFTQFSKILKRFRAHPVIPLMIIARQNYFYQNFHVEKSFQELCNKMHLPI